MIGLLYCLTIIYPSTEKAVICAHELGHHFLHREIAKKNTIFAESSAVAKNLAALDYEANLFATYLLCGDVTIPMKLSADWIIQNVKNKNPR